MSTKDWLEKDFYKVLGVSKTAEADEIKKSYRKLARKYHPDSNAGDASAEAKFKEVSEAYDVVGDPKKRKEYDEARRLFGSGGFRMPSGSGQGGGGFNFDVGDLFNRGGRSGGGGGGLGDILGGMFGGGGRTTTTTSTARPRRGADIETEATIEFAEAVNGVTVALRMTSDEPCKTCRGTGAKYGTVPKVCLKCEGTGMQTSVQGGVFAMTEPCTECKGRGLVVDQPCETCHGSGRGQSSKTMQVRIPAGVQDGQRIRLKGKGAAGERGGPAGDLYVTVHVQGTPDLRPAGRAPDAERPGELHRGRARRRDQGADPGRHARHGPDPRWYGERQQAARPWQGLGPAGRHQGRHPAHPRGAGPARADRRAARQAAGVQLGVGPA